MIRSKFSKTKLQARLCALCALSWLAVPMAGHADVIFELLGNSGMFAISDGQSSVSITNGGVVATLEASEGDLNQNSSSFGVNGSGTDDADALNLDQYIDITFDQAVFFKNVNVSSWGTGCAAEVQLGITTFTNQGSISSTGDTAYDFKVDYGETVRIIATGESSSTNGFSVDSFTVEAIPEPAVISFIALIGIGGLAARRLFE